MCMSRNPYIVFFLFCFVLSPYFFARKARSKDPQKQPENLVTITDGKGYTLTNASGKTFNVGDTCEFDESQFDVVIFGDSDNHVTVNANSNDVVVGITAYTFGNRNNPNPNGCPRVVEFRMTPRRFCKEFAPRLCNGAIQ